MSEFWYGLIWLTLFIPMMFLWGFALWDIFTRQDLSGLAKALWAIAIVFLPILGMLVYFIARPKDADRYGGYGYGSMYADPYTPASYRYRPEYERASGPNPDATDLATISRLHDSGTLSDDEFNELKDRLSTSQMPASTSEMPEQQRGAA